MFLNKYGVAIPIVFAYSIYSLGHWLSIHHPELGTNGMQLLIWGFSISTVVLMHATFTINSLAHLFGSARYNTQDDSKNNS